MLTAAMNVAEARGSRAFHLEDRLGEQPTWLPLLGEQVVTYVGLLSDGSLNTCTPKPWAGSYRRRSEHEAMGHGRCPPHSPWLTSSQRLEGEHWRPLVTL